MSSNSPSDPTATAGQAPAAEDVLPIWDTSPPLAVPVAVPVPAGEGLPPETVPLALPVSAGAPPVEEAPLAIEAPPAAEAPPAEAPPAPDVRCPVCDWVNAKKQSWCGDCGYCFSPAELEAKSAPAAVAAAGPVAAPAPPAPGMRLQERYELGEQVSDRLGVTRFRAVDHGDGSRPPVPVFVLRQQLPPPTVEALAEFVAEPVLEAVPVEEDGSEEILPTFDEAISSPVTQVLTGQPPWPSIAWERRLLRTLEHPALPEELAYFTDDAQEFEYLVEEAPTGQSLWDAWDDPDAAPGERFGHLAELAEVLHRLHQGNAMLEGLRPDVVVLGTDGHVRIADLSDLLPIPVPADAPIRGRLYTAPELLSSPATADARSELYSFGAMIYALHLGRELTEAEFDRAGAGHPKPVLAKFPDLHPALARLLLKTFRREVEVRFPTDEASKEDATGFTELAHVLEVMKRSYDNVRLEVASWTTTGIVRTGNEDAFAVYHGAESRQDDVGESVLILLCDGMGGYEAGEVAAALAIQVLRQTLLAQKPFNALGGASHFGTDVLTQMSRPEGHAGPAADVDAIKKALKAALREANKQVFAASRAPGTKRRGMGCTAEAVYVDGRNVIVGHVGDSRTYHLHQGQMVQLTRDQTLVNRLVELGTLTAEEAETHPRRNELQQAIGGQPDVEPGVYAGVLKPGDWVVVCSDGLSNHISGKDLAFMLQREAESSQMAARRLVNLTNIEGATDNATVVVVRAT